MINLRNRAGIEPMTSGSAVVSSIQAWFLGQVRYLILSLHDLRRFPYFDTSKFKRNITIDLYNHIRQTKPETPRERDSRTPSTPQKKQ